MCSTALALELRTIDCLAGAAFIAFAFSAIALSLWGAGDARADPETYRRVYHMSVDDYVAERYRTAVLSTVALAIPVLMFVDRKRRRLWRTLVLVLAAVWAVAAVYGFWSWVESGFGVDPSRRTD